MSEISVEILEEVEDCIQKIKAFQKAHNRRIHSSIKKASKDPNRLEELEQFNIAIPEDFRALYFNYNGTKQTGFNLWELSIFLQFYWRPVDWLVRANKIIRIETKNPDLKYLSAFSSCQSLTLNLDPSSEESGEVPLLITLGGLSRNGYLAFDSTLSMLRSVCAAQDADILRFEPTRNDATHREKDEIYFDPKELWDVIKPFNKRAEYWPALIKDKVQWDEIDQDLPSDGIVHMDSKVKKLIFGDPQDY
jgi:hypothetical protein